MKVKVIKATLASYWYANRIGEVFEVETCTADQEKFTYKEVNREVNRYFDKDDVEIINEEKAMKREDKVSVEMTLQEAAWLYAITARANGTVGYGIYKIFKSLVDPDGKAYNKCVADKFDLIDYRVVQKEFEAAIFDKKSPAQIELEGLQMKISELQDQAAKLQGLISK